LSRKYQVIPPRRRLQMETRRFKKRQKEIRDLIIISMIFFLAEVFCRAL
jgi:hypothetical protein